MIISQLIEELLKLDQSIEVTDEFMRDITHITSGELKISRDNKPLEMLKYCTLETGDKPVKHFFNPW